MPSGGAPYGGATLLADTSAWTNARHLTGDEEADWDEAIRRRQIAICDAVLYELSQGARTFEELERLGRLTSALRRLPITQTEWHAALWAIQKLAEQGGGQHRGIRSTDALVVVTAERYGLAVLHYDNDFDRLARVVTFDNQRLSARSLP
jgi:predicted nucleic acid-binding protein